MNLGADEYRGADVEALEVLLGRFTAELPVEAPLGSVGREALG